MIEASPDTEWPACDCPSLDVHSGLCSPIAEDHAPDCPRGVFLAARNEGIAEEQAREEQREHDANQFALQAKKAHIQAGDPLKALDALNGDPDGLIRPFIGNLADAFDADDFDRIAAVVDGFFSNPGRVELCRQFVAIAEQLAGWPPRERGVQP